MGGSELLRFVALATGVRWGVRWPRDPKHVLFFYNQAMLVARTGGWGELAVENRGDDDRVGPEGAALSWPPDRIVGLHPENRLIPTTSVLEAHFRFNWRLVRSELFVTLTGGAELKFNWVGNLTLLKEDVPDAAVAVVFFPLVGEYYANRAPWPRPEGPLVPNPLYEIEPGVMEWVFGERLSSD